MRSSGASICPRGGIIAGGAAWPHGGAAVPATRFVMRGGRQVAIIEFVITLLSYWLSLFLEGWSHLLDYRAWQRFLSS
jgi:hypothetical protein